MTISVGTFLAAVSQNAARVTSYRHGQDGSSGACDCIGLIIGALRLAGVSYGNLHGSNWFIRNECDACTRIGSVSELQPGYIIFKAFESGESGWDLPDRYAKAADQRDYYHVGVVVSVNPLEIWHCTSRNGKGGVYIDTSLGKWRYAALASAVDYGRHDDTAPEKGEIPMQQATVRSENGKGANLRAKRDTGAALVDRIPEGSAVTVTATEGDWSAVTWQGKKGYVMTKFLSASGEAAESGAADTSAQAYVRTLTADEYNRLGEIADQMEKDLAFLRSIVGVG